ncbi:60S ribosomal protein L27a, partial [Fragariocoptes setiger]
MRNYHVRKNTLREYCPTINVEKLWSLVPKKAKAKDGKAPVINLVNHGYFKVLGKGSLPKTPIVVKARLFSARAEKKIKEAGGACILTA